MGHGFADASLHELEQATGVNKSGLYSEFEDKEDLFLQSLRYYLEGLDKKGLLTASAQSEDAGLDQYMEYGAWSRHR